MRFRIVKQVNSSPVNGHCEVTRPQTRPTNRCFDCGNWVRNSGRTTIPRRHLDIFEIKSFRPSALPVSFEMLPSFFLGREGSRRKSCQFLCERFRTLPGTAPSGTQLDLARAFASLRFWHNLASVAVWQAMVRKPILFTVLARAFSNPTHGKPLASTSQSFVEHPGDPLRCRSVFGAFLNWIFRIHSLLRDP